MLYTDKNLTAATLGLGNVTNESKATMFTNPNFTGNVTSPKILINKYGNVASGISWYSSNYNAWQDYMANSGTTGNGVRGNITAPSGTLVTAWARRSFIENASGFGWTFESGTNSSTTPSVVAEIRASDGAAKFGGSVTAPTFTVSANNLITTTNGSYLGLKSNGNEITIGGATDMHVNYRAALGVTPTTWYWHAGTSTRYATFNVGSLTANGTISTNSAFVNTGYPADAVLLAGGGATTLSGLYKHCCTFSMGNGSNVLATGLFTSCTLSSAYYYDSQTIPAYPDFEFAAELTLTFSVPASLPTLNETTIRNGTYKIDVTSYRVGTNGFEDRAWCIHSIGTNSVTIILAGTRIITTPEGFIVSVTKRM